MSYTPQTHIQSVATIVVCKGKRRTTLNNATQKSKDIEGREVSLLIRKAYKLFVNCTLSNKSAQLQM